MVERHKHWDWVFPVYELRDVLVKDRIVVLVYLVEHEFLNLIDDYSHVQQNFLSDGLTMPFENSFFLFCLLSRSKKRMKKKPLFVAVANGILLIANQSQLLHLFFTFFIINNRKKRVPSNWKRFFLERFVR